MTAETLGPQDWLNAPETGKLIAALTAKGAQVRFVGGCVRNALIHHPVEDIDVATPDRPETVVELLEAAQIKAVPTGIEHGTITAVVDGKPFEVTTLREDVTTYGRHADVSFTEEWQADAARRDLTMNAIYADPDGTIFDPFNGADDVRNGRVQFIGSAAERIKEDYLRILRFFRFSAHFGHGDPAPAALQAIEAAKSHLQELSSERVRTELLKLLAAQNPVPTLKIMAAIGVLSEVLPEAAGFERLARLVDIEANQLFLSDPLRRLGALVSLDKNGTTQLAARLRLSNAERDRLVEMQTNDTKIVCYLSIREVRRALYRIGPGTFKDLVLLHWATDKKETNAVQWRALLAMADSWVRPELPLTGADVMKAGVPEGPAIGEVMKEVEEWWIDSDFTEDEFSIVERLKAIVQATIY